MEKRYVVGFLFNRVQPEVVLVRKARPEWQRGRLNGVGGKIEAFDATPLDAMVREFEEETGRRVTEWDRYAILRCPNVAEIHFFRAVAGERAFAALMDQRANEGRDEPIEIHDYRTITGSDAIIGNLRYLLPMALDADLKLVQLYERSPSPLPSEEPERQGEGG